jgi:hypothetical protein
MRIHCPYLSSDVELSAERENHITVSHPDLLPEFREYLIRTLHDPDQVRLSARFKKARLFTRWFDSVRGGKYIVVVIISENNPVNRHWVVTAYIARRLSGGDIEWSKN